MKWVSRLVSMILIDLVRLYQLTLSRLIGPVCKFHPSCSRYFIESVQKYGPWRGTAKGIWRICRCNPFNKGGFDPP